MLRIVLRVVAYFFYVVVIFLFAFLYNFYRKIFKREKKKIIFGSDPIISNKYFSNALKEINLDSETIMKTYYSRINKKEDFDKYFDDFVPAFFKKIYKPSSFTRNFLALLFLTIYIIKEAKIIVTTFNGFLFSNFLASTRNLLIAKIFMYLEYFIYKISNIKLFIFSYGSDSYMYSRIRNTNLQNALLISYPLEARREKVIQEKVFFFSSIADIVLVGGTAFDGFPRWDITIPQFNVIDVNQWLPREEYSNADGKNGRVFIAHCPNHRGFKGTEFVIEIVNQLKDEGFNIELVLIEGVQNDILRQRLRECDILIEQLVYWGYALNAIEGMALGLPVISNISNEFYSFFSSYSFLEECPIVSANYKNLKQKLKELIVNPELRKKIGKLGRKYVEKYHSYKTFQYIFLNMLKKINGENVDLINLFHPLKSDYVKSNRIKLEELM